MITGPLETYDSSMNPLNAAEERIKQRVERQRKWDYRYLGIAKEVSTWSKDPSTQVGAILVNHELNREFFGYNGFPRGVQDLPERYADREIKYPMVVHAEVNCIIKAGDYAKGSTIYVYPSFSLPPICSTCCGMAIQAGVRTIVGFEPDMNDERVKRWLNSIAISKTMCEEAGITWRTVPQI